MFDYETLNKPIIRLSNSSPGNHCGTSWGGPKPGDPNAPAYLNAIPIPGGVELRWAYPSINPGAVSHTKIYRSRGYDFSKADEYAIAQGNTYIDFDFNGDQLNHYYWIQVVSIHNTEGAVVGPASAAALDSIGTIINRLSGKINDSHLSQALKSELEKIPRIDWLESRINTEIADREFANLELVTQIESLTNSVDDSAASIIEERGLRAEHDAALARAITELNVTMGDDLANVASTLQAGIKQNEDSIIAIGQRIDEVKLEVDGDIAEAVSILNTAIEKERTDRGEAITALSQKVDQVELDLGNELAQGMQTITAKIDKEIGDRTESVRILTESINAVQVKVDEDISSAIQSLTTQITEERDARTSAINTLSQAITDVQAQLEGDLAAAQSALTGQINSVYDGLDKRITANAAAITKAQSELEGEIAQVETNLSTNISTVNNKVTAIGALYTAKVNVNGLVGGFGVYNDGKEVEAGFDVDTFWIGKNTLKKKPFIVSGSDVYISSTFIEDASITNAKIAQLAVGTANIQSTAITNAKIADGAITNAKIENSAITSAKIAEAAITNAKIANGSIETAKIADAAITNAKIANLSVTEGKIADLSVSTGKIKDLAVDTLKIAGNAVTTSVATTSTSVWVTVPPGADLTIFFMPAIPDWPYTGSISGTVTIEGLGTYYIGNSYRRREFISSSGGEGNNGYWAYRSGQALGMEIARDNTGGTRQITTNAGKLHILILKR